MLDSTKVSKWQLYGVLTSLRVFECIRSKEVYCTNLMLGILISSVLQGLLVWAVYKWRHKLHGIRVIEWAYAVYLGIYCIISVYQLTTLDNVIPNNANVVVCIVLIAITCIYCAKLGLEALLRASLVVGVVVVVSMGVVLYGLLPRIQYTLYIQGESVLHYTYIDALQSVDTLLLCAISSSTPKRRAWKYLGIRLLCLEAITMVGMWVVGGTNVVSKYSYIDLASYSQPFGIQRSDAMYTSVTTLVCILNVAICISIIPKLTQLRTEVHSTKVSSQ